MESVQNVLEIHFHAPRLAKSSPNVSKQQLLLFQAEASDQRTGHYAKTKEKILLHRFS